MERTRATNDGRVKWQKNGGGFFVIPGKQIIKPGQVFWAFPEEIPAAFRDQVVPVDQTEAKKLEPTPDAEIPAAEPLYTIKARTEGGTWYDIVDGNGKVLNEKALHKDKAEKYLKSLLG